MKCFNCGQEMKETRVTPVGELPKTKDLPISLYYVHPKGNSCVVVDYVIQIGYRIVDC